MNFYETLFIARQDLTAPQAQVLAEQFTKVITDNGGSILKVEYCGLRSLAYKIKKNSKGHYLLFTLKASAEAIAEMERMMRINEDVLRYMSLKVEKPQEGPSHLVVGGKSNREYYFEAASSAEKTAS